MHYRNIKRLRKILRVLAKHGFGYLVDKLNAEQRAVGRLLVNLSPVRRRQFLHLVEPVRLRVALEELGPTFIKFGQVLSTRPDLLPPEYCRELERLQDSVPGCAFCDMEGAVEAELKRPIREAFAEFSAEPMAAASLAQVHRARLPDGRRVIVKVQRPGIEQTVAGDLDILEFLAAGIEQHFEESRAYNPTGMVRELRKSLARELDFNLEASNARRFREMFADDPTVHVPQVFLELSSARVLTMEEVRGIKITDLAALERAGLDRHVIAANGANAYLKQIFGKGFFHADPHPGNLFVLPENRVVFLDFGMTGRLHPHTKAQIIKILMGIIQGDMAMLSEAAASLGTTDERTDFRSLELDLAEFVDRNYVASLRDVRVGENLVQLVTILTRSRVRLAPELFLLARTLMTIEGVGKRLDPDFNLIELLEPFIKQLMRERHSPRKMAQDIMKFLSWGYNFMIALPRDMREIVTKVKQGKLRIEFEHRGLEGLISELDRVSNRLAFSLIIAALIVGSSIIMHADKGFKVLGHPALGVLGFLFAGLLGLWLAWSIIRSGKL
jgi:ubiquinone biosynthesis protein